MSQTADLVVHVKWNVGDESDDLAVLTKHLKVELLGLDVDTVGPVHSVGLTGFPDGAKGAAEVAGWLSVRLGAETARRVLIRIADWASRNNHVVEVRYGDDLLKVGHATRAQQEKIIDAWLAVHSPGS